MRPLLVYAETSVFGGEFDAEFVNHNRRFFRVVEAGRFRLVVSDRVQDEIMDSPAEVRGFYDEKVPTVPRLRVSSEVRELARCYMRNKIFKPDSYSDAIHVACAAVNQCAGLVSWNFRHIVNPDKIIRFNMVNVANGYPQLFIVSPRGIMEHEN